MGSNIAELLANLHLRGIELRVDGGRLRYRPVAAVDDRLRTVLVENKPAIVAALTQPQPEQPASEPIKNHPAAGIFPPLSDDEYRKLVEDIRKNGQRLAGTMHEGKVLDGVHRARACAELGIEFRSDPFSGPGSPIDFVISMNLRRRHLSVGQKCAAAEKAMPFYRAAAAERQKEHAGTAPGRKADTQRKNALSDPGKAAEHAAAAFGVSPRSLEDYRMVKKDDPKLAKKVADGEVPVSKAKREVKRTADRERAAKIEPVTKVLPGTKFATIVVDPPWDAKDEGDVNQMGRANPDYTTMTIDEIEKLSVAEMAPDNAHLYLWITNRSLPKGFDLMEHWGFRYVTMLTWCKPSIGVGNYYRNNTEHVLFGVKGKLSLLRQDVGTWFEAKRGSKQHSHKPVEFYELVESCSPGPWLEMFARCDRERWARWPNTDSSTGLDWARGGV